MRNSQLGPNVTRRSSTLEKRYFKAYGSHRGLLSGALTLCCADLGSGEKMLNIPRAFPKAFSQELIEVARSGEAAVSRIAGDFRISESHPQPSLKIADVEDGVKPGAAQADAAELREAKKHIRMLEEYEILRPKTHQLNRQQRHQTQTTGVVTLSVLLVL